ncbi:right-handed parallel beta-helix repeat-containing protein [Actinomadura sp. 6N118]|uniref:right-handed parallel beta-helix repeat-containing protein n=1 Tax=Actinomadura sp. 6N118 TaxID=3375151 RepID=UPI0037B4E065
MRTLVTTSLACATAIGTVLGVPPAAAAAPTEITVYVNPSGTATASAEADTATASAAGAGLAADRAVRTLSDAVRVVKARGAGVSKATMVLAPGVYSGSIDPGADLPATSLAVKCRNATLDGKGAAGYAITLRTSRSSVEGCRIKNYTVGGVLASGSGALSGIVVRKTTFSDLGTKRKKNRGKNGFGAVHLKNVRSAKITGNTFLRLENSQRYKKRVNGKLEVIDKYGNMHGVYFAVRSSGSKRAYNVVKGNTFDTISGDPIRMSDGSSYVYASANKFRNAGSNGMVTYWWFSRDRRCAKHNYAYKNSGRSGYKRPGGSSKTIPHVKSASGCSGSVKDGAAPR